jgi:hypothetical protein
MGRNVNNVKPKEIRKLSVCGSSECTEQSALLRLELLARDSAEFLTLTYEEIPEILRDPNGLC